MIVNARRSINEIHCRELVVIFQGVIMSISKVKTLILCSAFVPSLAFGLEEGSSSEVESIYLPTSASSSAYITFKSTSSMPGCHGNRGGYLHGDGVEKAYSAILAALKSGSKIKPYYQINANNEGWSKCYIKAISVY